MTRAGMINVEITIKKHNSATHIKAKAIYKKDLDKAIKGPPYCDLATSA
jgi:hypothetical protein